MKNTSRARLNALADIGHITLVLSQKQSPRILVAQLPASIPNDALNAGMENGDAVFAWAAKTIGTTSLAALRDADRPSVLFGDIPNGTLLVRMHRGQRILGILLHSQSVLPESDLTEALAAILTLDDEDGFAQIGALAPRELAYLQKAMAGFTDEEIAADLNLSMRSVKERKKRTIKDIGAVNLSHAVMLAKRSAQI